MSDWDGFVEWKSRCADWLSATHQSNKQMADLMEAFDRNVHPLQWPEKISPSVEVQWTEEHLLGEAKSGLSIAADRIRSSRSVYLAPPSSWKIVQHLTASSLELSNNLAVEERLTGLLPLAHALSHKNESAYLWMEHTRSALKVASCSALKHSSSGVGVEWSRWLRWYSSLDRQAVDMAVACAEADLSVVPQARAEGNLRLAERQLLKSMAGPQLLQGESHHLATLLMNETLRMKLTSISSARLSIQRQFEGAKLLHQ